MFPRAGLLLHVCLSLLTYQPPRTHAHLFIPAFLRCSHSVGFGKLPGCIPFIPADLQLLVTELVLWTPSTSKELTLKCRWPQSECAHKLLSAHIHARQSKEGSWPKHCDRLGGTCKNHQHSVYHPLSHTINQWSPTFLAPGLGFVEDGFSRDWGGVVRVACDGLGMIQVHYMYCALRFCYYYISSDSDHQVLDPEGWGPLPETAAWIHTSSSLRWCFLKYLGSRGSLRGLRKSEGDGPRLVEDRCTPCAGLTFYVRKYCVCPEAIPFWTLPVVLPPPPRSPVGFSWRISIRKENFVGLSDRKGMRRADERTLCEVERLPGIGWGSESVHELCKHFFSPKKDLVLHSIK